MLIFFRQQNVEAVKYKFYFEIQIQIELHKCLVEYNRQIFLLTLLNLILT